MKYIYQVAIIVILLILAFIFKDWLRGFIITSLGGYTQKETLTEIKTEYIEGKIDTIAFFNHYVETEGYDIVEKKIIKEEVTVQYEVFDTIKKTVVVIDSIKSVELKQFDTKVKDSLIDGVITVKNFFNGDLKSASIKYKPLFPKFLTKTDTIIKRIKETNTLSNENRAYFGVGAGFNNYEILSLSASYITENRWQFIGTFGKSLQDTKEIINGTPFTFEQKDFYGFTVIKNF